MHCQSIQNNDNPINNAPFLAFARKNIWADITPATVSDASFACGKKLREENEPALNDVKNELAASIRIMNIVQILRLVGLLYCGICDGTYTVSMQVILLTTLSFRMDQNLALASIGIRCSTITN